jgi:hypothetical protein
MKRILTIGEWALVAISSAFAVGIGANLMAGPTPTSVLTVPSKKPLTEIPAPPQIAPAPLQSFAVIDERPIFLAARKPPEVADAPEAKTMAPPPISFSLIGILVSGADRLAVLKPAAGGEALSLPAGAVLDAWTVAEIGADWIRLGSGAFEAELQLLPAGAAVPSFSQSPASATSQKPQR